MIGTMFLTSHAMAGGFWVRMADGSDTYLPDDIMMLLVVLVIVICLTLGYVCPEDTSSSCVTQIFGPPEEIQTPEPIEHYEEMTERTRALKHKLDADIELTESYIKAARARAELEDLDSEARRRGRGRQ